MEFLINGQVVDVPETQITTENEETPSYVHVGCEILLLQLQSGRRSLYIQNKNEFDVIIESGIEECGKFKLMPGGSIFVTEGTTSQTSHQVLPASQSRSGQRVGHQNQSSRER